MAKTHSVAGELGPEIARSQGSETILKSAWKQNLLIVLVAFLAATSAEGQARVCRDVFSPAATRAVSFPATPRLEKELVGFRTLLNESPTSLRREDKFIVDTDASDFAIETISKKFGESFQLRDPAQPNSQNVTVTLYALPIRFHANGHELSGKLRLRKYYSTPESERLKPETFVDAEITKGFQFLELKIDHPEIEGVVVKPRIRITDADALTIQSRRSFLANRKRLKADWLKLNKSASEPLIEAFLTTLAEYIPVKRALPKYATTMYQRDSYSLRVASRDGTQKPIEVQLTLDRSIEVVDEVTHSSVNAYTARDVVVEMKVPLTYSGLTPENIKDYPGLQDVAALKAYLAAKHNPAYKAGSGKLSTFKSIISGGLDD